MAMHVDTDDKTSTLIQVSGYNYQNGTFESLRDTLMLTVTTKRRGSRFATPSIKDSLGRDQYPVLINE